MYAAYSKNNIYSLGIINDARNLNSLAFKTVTSRLNKNGETTIPIGNRKDDNKLIFILIALGLSILMAGLINTRKKFREDCSRALFKPYNFFADIRDNRILPSLHTLILLFVEAGSISLLFTIVLFYLKSNILLEKIILSFGSIFFIDTVSKLAWHPEQCFFILFIIAALAIIMLTGIIKIASLFIKTKVDYSEIFYSAVWALLPFTLLLPAELILYKVLVAYNLNIIVITIFVIFAIWMIQRTLKGIYVIFDVNPFTVYLYSITIVVLVTCILVLYFQLTNSTIYYISNAIRQYQLMAF